MGYNSDLRVILRKKDFEELKEKMSKYYQERNCGYDLFKESDYLNIIEENENWVKFGWNGLKWYYPQYKDVEMIQDFITSRDQFYFLRLGEEYGDMEERQDLEYDNECPEISYVYHYIED